MKEESHLRGLLAYFQMLTKLNSQLTKTDTYGIILASLHPNKLPFDFFSKLLVRSVITFHLLLK